MSQWVSEWHGHLLSCSEKLEINERKFQKFLYPPSWNDFVYLAPFSPLSSSKKSFKDSDDSDDNNEYADTDTDDEDDNENDDEGDDEGDDEDVGEDDGKDDDEDDDEDVGVDENRRRHPWEELAVFYSLEPS